MPRYELKDGKSSKFWEIELDESSFTTRWGRIGTAGQETSKDFDSRGEAKREYDKLVAEKTKKGYLLVSAGGGDAPVAGKTNPELEATIFANPSDDHGFVIYGDWLEANGDPRGELIALQAAYVASPSPEMNAKIDALLRGNEEFFYGAEAAGLVGTGVTATWRLGFFDTLRISLDYDDADGNDIEDLLDGLLRHPSARFLRGLTVGMFNYEGENHYEGVVSKLAKLGPRPTLQSLHLGDFEYPDETEISWANVGDIGKLWALYPNLETVTLQGGEIGLGKIQAPKLQSLTLRTGGLPKGALKSVAAAQFPALERLEIWTGADEYGADSSFADAKPILDGRNLPKLKHLGLCNSEYAHEILEALPGAKILKQLRTLDLSKGVLKDTDAQVFLDNRGAFAHLEGLNLAENHLSSEMTGKLASVCAGVDASEQRDADDDDDNRYVAVGE